MTTTAVTPRILALAVLGAIASFGAHGQAQTTTATPASPSTQAAARASPESIEACTTKATTLLDALDRGDYAGAETDFSDSMRSGLTTDQLKAGWESLPQKFGARGARGAPQNSSSNGYTVITVPLAFQNGTLAAQVACASDGKIAGFHVMTLPSPEPALPSTAPVPAPTSTAAGH
ncbi:MAG: DUF3887 domain-containing protein [Rhodanobacteraceae bacterium]